MNGRKSSFSCIGVISTCGFLSTRLMKSMYPQYLTKQPLFSHQIYMAALTQSNPQNRSYSSSQTPAKISACPNPKLYKEASKSLSKLKKVAQNKFFHS